MLAHALSRSLLLALMAPAVFPTPVFHRKMTRLLSDKQNFRSVFCWSSWRRTEDQEIRVTDREIEDYRLKPCEPLY